MSKVGLNFEFTEVGSKKVKGAIQDVQGSAASMGAGFAVVANQALELGKKVEQAAKAVYDFAKAGANAADIGARFASLGAAVPAVNELRAALQGTVDETSMQQFAILSQSLGITAEESVKAASSAASMAIGLGRASETAKILDALVKGNIGTLREYGVAIDMSAESMEGLGRSEKKAQIIRDFGAKSTELSANAIDSQTLAMAQAETVYADMISNLQVMTAQAVISSGALDIFKAAIAKINDFAIRHADLLERVATVAGKVLLPVFENLAIVIEYNAMVIDTVLAVLEPFLDMLGKLSDVIHSLPGIFEKTSRSIGVMEESLDRIRKMAAETTAGLQEMAAANEELKAATDPATLSAEFFADELEQNLLGALGGTDQAFRTIVGSAKDAEEALYMLDTATAIAFERYSAYNEVLASDYMSRAGAAADELTTRIEEHFSPATKKATSNVKEMEAAGLALTWTLTGMSDALADTAMRLADYQSPTERLAERLADGFDRAKTSIEESIEASRGWGGVLRVLQRQSDAFAKNVSSTFGKSAEERAALVAELNMAELRSIVETTDAYAQAAMGILDSIAPFADTAAIKAAIGFLNASALVGLNLAEGNIPGAASAAASAINYAAMQAFAESKGGSSGASAGASPAAASAAASTPPSELDRGGRGMGDQTLVFRVGERTFGEVAIKSANAAARNRSLRLDSSIVGSTSSRRGRI